MAPTKPAPKTACGRGAAPPVKTGAAGVVDDGAFEEATLSHVVLLAVTGATGVEAELLTLMKLGAGVEDNQAAEVELVTTGFTGVVEEEDEVELADHGPQDVVEELVTTGWIGVTGMNDETEDHAAQVSDEELVITGITGVEEELEDDEEVHTAQVSDEDELVTTGLTGVVEDDDELDEEVQTAHVSEEELLLGTTGVTGLTGVVEDEELDEEVQTAHVSEEELLIGTTGVTGLTGVVEEEEDDDAEVEFHTPHTADEEELEHSDDDVMVVVTVTGGRGMYVVTIKVGATGVEELEEVHGAHVVYEDELELLLGMTGETGLDELELDEEVELDV